MSKHQRFEDHIKTLKTYPEMRYCYGNNIFNKDRGVYENLSIRAMFEQWNLYQNQIQIDMTAIGDGEPKQDLDFYPTDGQVWALIGLIIFCAILFAYWVLSKV